MKTIMELFNDKILEIIKKRSQIIESYCKNVCEKFDLKPEQIVMNYHSDNSIEFLIKVAHIKIDTEFTYDGLPIFIESKEIPK
jgi:hypothetical protein